MDVFIGLGLGDVAREWASDDMRKVALDRISDIA
jgi:hypothetical protein